MIPKYMQSILTDRLPDRTWNNRLLCENGRCFMEFGPLDVERVARVGLEVDHLGPHLLVCMGMAITAGVRATWWS
jgi:glutamate dehydrogenase (NAD(P)+)